MENNDKSLLTHEDIPGMTVLCMESVIKYSESLVKKSQKLYRLSIAINIVGVVLMLLLKLL